MATVETAASAAQRAPGTDRPLVLTGDAGLLDDLLRLAAAAGSEVEVAPDPVAARSPWATAPLVLVGDDVCGAVARARLRRRPHVVVVGRDGDNAGIWQHAVAIGAEHVALLPDAEAWLATRLGEAGEGGTDPIGRIVSVVGGRGGAGASTLAAALAVTGMRQRRRAMLVDGDPLGGGADLLFGGEQAAGMRWPELSALRGRIAAPVLRSGLPAVGTLAVLSWDRGEPVELAPEAMASVLDAAARSCDLVVVDVARHLDEIGRVAVAASDLTLLVVPAEVRATAAAARVATTVRGLAVDLRLVVRGPAPGGLDARDVGGSLDLPVGARLDPEPDLAAALERGEAPAGRGVGPLARVCGQLLADLDALPAAS